MFTFFRGSRLVFHLWIAPQARAVGRKAAGLSQLWAWGYPVPRGYVVQAERRPQTAVRHYPTLTPAAPWWCVLSSQDEDTDLLSAAGIYDSFLNITSKEALALAIARCFAGL